MKKVSIILIAVITFVLSGCEIQTDGNTITQAELEVIIEQLVEERIEEQQMQIDYTIEGFEEAVTSMLADARNGVLGLVVVTNYTTGTGSGVIYKKEPVTIVEGGQVLQGWEYYMVTNDHVLVHEDLQGNRNYPIYLTPIYEKNGLLFEIDNSVVEYIGSDPVTDLGVIRFRSTQEFEVIPFADSYEIKVGQFVFAVGNPLGFDYYGTVTMGVVSGTARYYMDGEFDATLLQHDAAISPGNSGGALLNINGELIGINNMKIVEDYVSNIGFAIPSNTVHRIVTDLEDDGQITRPYLGVSSFAQVNQCGYNYGACLTTVFEGGAADNAGLQDGDLVIGYKNEGMDDFLVINNFNDLREAILNSFVGETIVIKYIRNGEIIESSPTTLDVHPDDQ